MTDTPMPELGGKVNQDQRALLLLAAQSLRMVRTHDVAPSLCDLLADALDRIAGEGKEERTVVRFGPNTEETLGVISAAWTAEDSPLTSSVEQYGAEGPPRTPSRFTPNSGKCWRCRTPDHAGTTLCEDCLHRVPYFSGSGEHEWYAHVRTWIESEAPHAQ